MTERGKKGKGGGGPHVLLREASAPFADARMSLMLRPATQHQLFSLPILRVASLRERRTSLPRQARPSHTAPSSRSTGKVGVCVCVCVWVWVCATLNGLTSHSDRGRAAHIGVPRHSSESIRGKCALRFFSLSRLETPRLWLCTLWQRLSSTSRSSPRTPRLSSQSSCTSTYSAPRPLCASCETYVCFVRPPSVVYSCGDSLCLALSPPLLPLRTPLRKLRDVCLFCASAPLYALMGRLSIVRFPHLCSLSGHPCANCETYAFFFSFACAYVVYACGALCCALSSLSLPRFLVSRSR